MIVSHSAYRKDYVKEKEKGEISNMLPDSENKEEGPDRENQMMQQEPDQEPRETSHRDCQRILENGEEHPTC